MRTRRPVIFTIVGVIIALGVTTTPVYAQQWLSYAAKFVCGVQTGVPTEQPVVNGKYRTVVNIHNPHYLMDVTGAPAPAVFFKKVVLALPQGQIPVRPSCVQFESLNADHALAVDCSNIRQLFTLSGIAVPIPFDGFVVLEVPPQTINEEAPDLDVTAVYTARHRPGLSADVADYDVQTIEVEQVTPRRIIGQPELNQCPDLDQTP